MFRGYLVGVDMNFFPSTLDFNEVGVVKCIDSMKGDQAIREGYNTVYYL